MPNLTRQMFVGVPNSVWFLCLFVCFLSHVIEVQRLHLVGLDSTVRPALQTETRRVNHSGFHPGDDVAPQDVRCCSTSPSVGGGLLARQRRPDQAPVAAVLQTDAVGAAFPEWLLLLLLLHLVLCEGLARQLLHAAVVAAPLVSEGRLEGLPPVSTARPGVVTWSLRGKCCGDLLILVLLRVGSCASYA